jgi:predicted transcriptional regulator
MKVEIIKIDANNGNFDETIRREHREVVVESEDLYPGIDLWYDRKVKLGLEKGERVGYLVKSDGNPVGAAVVRQGEDAKICSVRVTEKAIHKGIGKIIFLLLAHSLRHDTKKVHFTAPETLWNSYKQFFEEMGFVNQGLAGVQYRLFVDPEIAATADFKSFKSSVYQKFLPLYAGLLANLDGDRIDLIFSVKPEYAEKIADRTKIMELRRKFSPKWKGHYALIYSTSPIQAFIAKVRVKDIIVDNPATMWLGWSEAIGCKADDYFNYTKDLSEVYGILFDEVKQFDPIPRSTLEHLLNHALVPPQSYCSVENNPSWQSAIGISHLLRGNI